MTTPEGHQWYCFATQPAPCPGYFPDDVLPCVCGDPGSLLGVMIQILMRSLPVREPVWPTAA
jgi:hypothetical protein